MIQKAFAFKHDYLSGAALVAVLVHGGMAQAAPNNSDSDSDSSRVKLAAVMIGSTPLPDQVPYLNKTENFFVGGGIAAGGGAADGSWNFLAGPGYSCPNYLGREEIRLAVDGVQQVVTVNVHRARNTGVFYGQATFGDLEVCLIDHASQGKPWAARLVMVRNQSVAVGHQISVQASITPLTGEGRSAAIVVDSSGRNHGVSLKLDTSLECVKNRYCRNWAPRYALITFTEPTTVTTNSDGAYLLATPDSNLAPGGVYNVALYHYLHYRGQSDSDCIGLVHDRNAVSDAELCIRQWQSWFANVAPQRSLDRIKEPRARDIVEGGLAMLKMNEAGDGGMVANEMGYNISYVRDAYCGLRGLEENGHFAEVKAFIQWLDHKYSVHGYIPNACSCGSDTYAHPNGNNGKICPEANAAVEVTALYLLVARDYYQATHDLATLTNAGNSLKYAMDIQLKQAAANGCKLEFGGDETELCGASDVSSTGFNRKLSEYWSMTSIALCSASLDFYIQYLKMTGTDPAAYLNPQDHRTLNLYEVFGRLQDALETDFWRTDLPEFPAGFHDCFRFKADNGWPHARIVNFTLFPIYYGTTLKYPNRASNDVACVYHYFDATKPLLSITGAPGIRPLGHDLGYLLWGLLAVGDSRQAAVYHALVNGPTVGCWGTYNEAYDLKGTPNVNGLRSFETGVNVSAIAKYWDDKLEH